MYSPLHAKWFFLDLLVFLTPIYLPFLGIAPPLNPSREVKLSEHGLQELERVSCVYWLARQVVFHASRSTQSFQIQVCDNHSIIKIHNKEGGGIFQFAFNYGRFLWIAMVFHIPPRLTDVCGCPLKFRAGSTTVLLP